jgi:hypothetical protein
LLPSSYPEASGRRWQTLVWGLSYNKKSPLHHNLPPIYFKFLPGQALLPSSPLRLVAGRLVLLFFKSSPIVFYCSQERCRSGASSPPCPRNLLLEGWKKKQEYKNKIFATRSSTLCDCPSFKPFWILVYYRHKNNVGCTLFHSCLKVDAGVPIAVIIFLDPLVVRINCLVIRELLTVLFLNPESSILKP